MLTGCDRAPASPAPETAQETANFAPETTAVASSENVLSPIEAPDINEVPAETEPPAEEQPVAMDSAATPEPVAQEVPAETPTSEPVSQDTGDQPFTPTPQPNARVDGYTEVSNTGLGFRFNYPTGWNNIPGRSTVCFVQPLENGTVYPARVAVTMKQVAHKLKTDTAQEQFVEYLQVLMSQYDEKTFEVDDVLDTETKFMGNKAFSTTYLAYDGDQEIQGYVIMTWFEKYLFCYHFLCAYEDFGAFTSAMYTMRDSVQPESLEPEAT